MNSLTILGAGRVGSALAATFAQTGREVIVGVRDPERVRADWTGPGVIVQDVPTAIEHSELIINATPGDTSLERFTALEYELSGKILVDVSNATTRGSDGMPGGLVYTGVSLGELLQSALAKSPVVKTLNTMLFSAMTAPGALGSTPTVFLSGDDGDAKAQVRELLASLGWENDWMRDLGGIQSARGTEALALLVPSLLGALGFAPFALSVARSRSTMR